MFATPSALAFFMYSAARFASPFGFFRKS